MAGLAGGRARSHTGIGSGVVAAVVAVGGVVTHGGIYFAVELGIVWAIAAIGLDVYSGFVGDPQFGQAAFVAIGAYLGSWLRVTEGVGGIAAFACCIVFTGLAGYILGSVTVRLGHFGSAVTTFFAGFVVLSVAQSTLLGGITNSEAGVNVPPLSLNGSPFTNSEFYYLEWGVLVAALAVSSVLARGRTGREWRLVKSNELVASAFGVNPRSVKRWALMYCAMLAGAAGFLLAPLLAIVTPEVFPPSQSVMLFAMVIIGGIGSVAGAVIGAIGFELLSQVGVSSGGWSSLIFALVFLFFLVALPEGIYGFAEDLIRFVRSKIFLLTRSPSEPAVFDGMSGARSRNVDNRLTAVSVQSSDNSFGASSIDGERKAHASHSVRFGSHPSGGTSVEQISANHNPGLGELDIRNVHVAFGGVVALDGVSLTVRSGTTHAVIGPNGAGKTTLIGAITGIVKIQCGDVILDNKELRRSSPEARYRSGLARTFQHASLVSDLTIVENVLLGSTSLGTGSSLSRERMLDITNLRSHDPVALDAAERALDQVGISHARWNKRVNDLSAAEQKLVDLARAFSGNPRVVLLDEPTSGLDDKEGSRVEAVISDLQERAVSVLLVAHDVGFVRRLAKSCTVLDYGKVIADGVTEEVLKREHVTRAYLGGSSES